MNLIGSDHAELREDVRLHGGRGGRRQRDDRRGIERTAQTGQILAQHAVVGTEVVAPLRDAMRLVDRDQRQLALGQHLREPRHAQPFRRNEQKLQAAPQDNPRKPAAPRRAPFRSECAPRKGLVRRASPPGPPSAQSAARSPAPFRRAQSPATGSTDSSPPRSASPAAGRALRWPRGTPAPGRRETAQTRIGTSAARSAYPDWKRQPREFWHPNCKIL